MAVWDKEKLYHYLEYERKFLLHEEWLKEVEEWKKQGRRFILGSYSATELKKEKLLRLENTLFLEEFNASFSFTEIGKAILSTLPDRKRYIFPFSAKDFEIMKDNFAGYYAKTGKQDGCWIYADIKAFYFTIYSTFLGVEYRRGARFGIKKHLRLTKEQINFLRENKKLRNTIFGIMRNTTRNLFDGTKFILQKAHNKFLNPQLANLIYDLSKAIAYKSVVEFGGIYYNTDGAIIPCENFERFKQFLSHLGLRVEIKAKWERGVIIKGVGIYGGTLEEDVKTLHFDRVALKENQLRTNIDLDDTEVEFILHRLHFWLEKLA